MKKCLNIWGSLLSWLLVFSSGNLAVAAPTSGALLSLVHESAVSADNEIAIRSAISQTLTTKHGVLLVPFSQVQKVRGQAMAKCNSVDCLQEAAIQLGVKHLFGGQLGVSKKQNAPAWSIALWMFNAEKKATVAVAEERCIGCQIDEVKKLSRQLVSRLLTEAQTEGNTARLIVSSSPTGAQVNIDDKPAGVTNMQFIVEAGRHIVAVKMAGFTTVTQEIELEPQTEIPWHVNLPLETKSLSPTLNNQNDENRSFFSARVFKWLTLGLAIPVAASGGILLSLDQKGTCDTSRPADECPSRYQTRGLGWGLIGTGAVLAGAAVYLFFVDYKNVAVSKDAATNSHRLNVGMSVKQGWTEFLLRSDF